MRNLNQILKSYTEELELNPWEVVCVLNSSVVTEREYVDFINNVEKVGASTAVAWAITPKTKPPRIDCTRPVSYTKRPPKKTPTKAPIRKLLTILSMS